MGEATVNQVVEAITDPPTAMAVRRMMHILEGKGHLKRRENGREVVYMPRAGRVKEGRSAFQNDWTATSKFLVPVVTTRFGGDSALCLGDGRLPLIHRAKTMLQRTCHCRMNTTDGPLCDFTAV